MNEENEEEPPSMVVAAELVVAINDEEDPDFEHGNRWELKVQEEVQTRLMELTRQENMAVAEAITLDKTATVGVDDGM